MAVVVAFILGAVLLLAVILFIVLLFLYLSADFRRPEVKADAGSYGLSVDDETVKVCGDSILSLNRYGLWEARIQGNPVERGIKYGILHKKLLKSQEDVFVKQIYDIVPSRLWVRILHNLTIIFNRNMARHIPLEYRTEIYAMSLSCSSEYNSFCSPYCRQLNYHAAHDIGHAMQEYMLVGCTSFACWGGDSEDGRLIVGRNFDFNMGDDFARNKIMLFVEPEKGYRYFSVSWPGMMGVLSGMNEKGLTVTVNAAKGPIPLSSAMPVSLLARDILQYASNIDEAYSIAGQFKTFVSESFLIGSASDGCAAIIEKTPKKISLYRSSCTRIICSNHYQSDAFKEDKHNKENIVASDSMYRYRRTDELLSELAPISVCDAVSILRDRRGIGNVDIGLGSEKSINQFAAHHSVVFQPEALRVWVSSSHWLLGEYICYDLNRVFSSAPATGTYVCEELNVAADKSAIDDDYVKLCRYRELLKEFRTAIKEKRDVPEGAVDDFIACNPNFFQVYSTLGDYELARNNRAQALFYWKKSLSLEIPKLQEKDAIMKKIKKYD